MQDRAGLGAKLRECREARGFSLDDLSRATRIVPRQLLALEEDRFRDLPAPVFVRGFIRAYCAAVAEPPELPLAAYERWVAATVTPMPVPPTVLVGNRHRGIGWRALAPPLLVAGTLVVVGGAVYLLASSAATRPSDGPRSPDGTVVPAVPPAPGPATTPGQAGTSLDGVVAVSTVPEPVPPETAHVLVVRAHEPTWLSVRADDGATSEELLESGGVREWRSAGRFTLTVGNAGGVTLEVDGVALPSLGERGQVVRDLQVPREPPR